MNELFKNAHLNQFDKFSIFRINYLKLLSWHLKQIEDVLQNCGSLNMVQRFVRPALTAFADQPLIKLKLVYCILNYHVIKTLIYFRKSFGTSIYNGKLW